MGRSAALSMLEKGGERCLYPLTRACRLRERAGCGRIPLIDQRDIPERTAITDRPKLQAAGGARSPWSPCYN